MRKYPAKFIKEENEQYSVLFQGDGMEGCMTYGNDFEDARRNDLYIETLYSAREKISLPSDVEGDDIYYFEPEANMTFAVIFRHEREGITLTQSEMALRIGISPAQYQRLENQGESYSADYSKDTESFEEICLLEVLNAS